MNFIHYSPFDGSPYLSIPLIQLNLTHKQTQPTGAATVMKTPTKEESDTSLFGPWLIRPIHICLIRTFTQADSDLLLCKKGKEVETIRQTNSAFNKKKVHISCKLCNQLKLIVS